MTYEQSRVRSRDHDHFKQSLSAIRFHQRSQKHTHTPDPIRTFSGGWNISFPIPSRVKGYGRHANKRKPCCCDVTSDCIQNKPDKRKVWLLQCQSYCFFLLPLFSHFSFFCFPAPRTSFLPNSWDGSVNELIHLHSRERDFSFVR